MVCPKADKINEALTEMAEQQMRLSMGILIDIVDDEWMRDTLPDDDIPLPSVMADKADDAEDSHQESQQAEKDEWRDLALENLQA
ncbi:anaphase-promoting complex subunit 13-like isoform X2 [Zingiber officinale]|nr:anaphase-promoting complex subunit 13-like isoform X2 [Zingiber officinale]